MYSTTVGDSLFVKFFSILLIPFMPSCRSFPSESISGIAWQTPGYSNAPNSSFFPEVSYPSLSSKSDFGICFSGGGNRSATATLGQLRALRHTGILERAKYISAVSGGAWGSAPWVFLQDTSADAEDLFLGKMVMPNALTAADLFDQPVAGSFAASASNAGIPLVRFARTVGGDENFGHNISRIFLEPHGIGSTRRIPVYGQEEMKRFVAMNPLFSEKDFLVCKEGRPYFIAGSALSRRDHVVSNPEDLYVPFEFTTSYAGSRQSRDPSRKWWPLDASVGGGYQDNATFDGWPFKVTATAPGRFEIAVDKSTPFPYYGASSRLSLPDILGATGAAPTAVIPSLANILGFPEFNHTSPANYPTITTRELLHTDGGAIDNLGVMPLLSRGVKNILIFYNTEGSLESGNDNTLKIPAAIGYLFGESNDCGILKKRGERLARMNYVFKDFDRKLRDEMVASFGKSIQEKRTLIHYETYETLDNKYHSIKGGNRVNICWVVLGPAGLREKSEVVGINMNSSESVSDPVELSETTWFASIKNEHLKKRLKDERKLKDFPHFKTFFANGNNVIDLTPLQVNTLAHFTSYSVAVNAGRIKSHLQLR